MRKRVVLPSKTCPGCGNTFTPKRTNQLYCSDTCRYAKHNGKVERALLALDLLKRVYDSAGPSDPGDAIPFPKADVIRVLQGPLGTAPSEPNSPKRVDEIDKTPAGGAPVPPPGDRVGA